MTIISCWKSAPDALETAVILHDPANGIRLTLATTEPGIQVYSTNNVKLGTFNARGQQIHPRDALALETQHFPDSPNQPEFPSTILRPGETFHAITEFRFDLA